MAKSKSKGGLSHMLFRAQPTREARKRGVARMMGTMSVQRMDPGLLAKPETTIEDFRAMVREECSRGLEGRVADAKVKAAKSKLASQYAEHTAKLVESAEVHHVRGTEEF